MSNSYISNITVNDSNYLIKDSEARASIDVINGVSGSDAAIKTITIDGVATTKDGTSVDLPAYPTSLPASDVKDWAKADTKPTYTASEVGAIASTVTHLSGDIAATEKGANGGVATLGSDGKIPSSQLPSYVDDVEEYSAKSSFPTTGESGKIYIDTTTNITYRWGGSEYVAIGSDLALGETSSTAYAGDKGKAVTDALASHKDDTTSHITAAERTAWNAKTSNTGTVTSVEIKMNNVSKGTVTTNGTIDLGAVITSHQDISGKQDKLTAGSNIAINGSTISATDTTYTFNTTYNASTNKAATMTDVKNGLIIQSTEPTQKYGQWLKEV